MSTSRLRLNGQRRIVPLRREYQRRTARPAAHQPGPHQFLLVASFGLLSDNGAEAGNAW